MVRSSFLASLVVASVVLTQLCAASPHALVDLQKRDGDASSDDFGARIIIQSQGNADTIDATASIARNMALGLPFFGLLDKTHVPGTDDSQTYVIHDEGNMDTWGDGAYSQAKSCLKAAEPTLRKAMKACGPKEMCQSDFVLNTAFGTAAGMDWTKDGLLLYQCVALQTDKSQCADTLNGPCKLTILGEYHKKMIQAGEDVVALIGDGATSLSQMAQQIDEYNQAHGTSLSPPSGGSRRKRSTLRRLASA